MQSSPSRRQFLQSTATVSGAIAAMQVTGTLLETSRLQADDKPESPWEVIDCHTHFYDPSRSEGVPWPEKGSSLYRTVLPKHLRALEKPLPLTGTVVVEASKWIEDNQWILDLAADDPFIVGFVGRLFPGDEKFTEYLKRFAANPLYRGIRLNDIEIADAIASHDKKILDDLKLLIDHDLELDLNGGPSTSLTAAALAKQLPELRIVINHLSNVKIDGKQPPREWETGMRQAAKEPNIFCKVSALVEGASRDGNLAPAELDYYRPILDIMWDAFGDDRLMYGSNWPVSDRGATYAVVQQLVYDYVKERGLDATRKFFAGNAAKIYKWVDRPNRVKQSD
jgi:predicted TIM-barrel fold metal-dependent hydrolase